MSHEFDFNPDDGTLENEELPFPKETFEEMGRRIGRLAKNYYDKGPVKDLAEGFIWFGEHLRKVRRESNVSRGELSQRTGLSKEYLLIIEGGTMNIQELSAYGETLAAGLNVTLAELTSVPVRPSKEIEDNNQAFFNESL